MKIKNILIAIIVFLTAILSFQLMGATNSPQPKKSNISNKQLTEIARDSYIFTYPLVMNYRTMYRQAIKGVGFGNWLHLSISNPSDKDIVTPLVDSVYSYAWLDLRTEPYVLTIPKMEKNRYFTSQWDDMWAYILDNVGSVNDGNKSIKVLLASPTWHGQVPKGINRVIRGESDFLGTLTRTQLIGDNKDLKRVQEIQKSLKLQPLSAYLGKTAPQPAKKIDFPKWHEGSEKTELFWNYTAFVLQYIKVNPVDKAMYTKLKKIGIEPGKEWQKQQFSKEQLKAIQQGAEQAYAYMDNIGKHAKNAGQMFGNRQRLKTDYLNRTMGVFLGIFGNTIDQSFYFGIPRDEKNQLLNGAKHDYQITFAKNKLPPVKYFWSLTMYNLPDRFLVANSDNRYSFNNTTPNLIYNKDGSITFYVANKKPQGLPVNWLPAPKGPFWLVLRNYGPKPAVINGSWKIPAVEVVK